MHLSELHIYPIKSARGISLATSRLDARGLEFDRRWMLVDESGGFLTQRKLPRMALIRVAVLEHSLLIKAAVENDLTVPLHPAMGPLREVTVWNDTVEAIDCGDEAARWFTLALDRSCRLVWMPDESKRIVDPRNAHREALVGFADAYPLLLISQASLDDLNSRLKIAVPMDRFRPNIVINGCNSYEEDTWRDIQIGAVKLRMVKPCARCAVPTVNQETGKRGVEPIRTLESYRTKDGKVLFGQNVVHEGEGALAVGDTVTVISLR
jgi:uncharacterized protein YcbX